MLALHWSVADVTNDAGRSNNLVGLSLHPRLLLGDERHQLVKVYAS